MYAARVTSLLFMNIYRIYIYIVYFSSFLCWWVTKKGEGFRFIYSCLFVFMHIYVLCIFICICLWFWYPKHLLLIHSIGILIYIFCFIWYLSFFEYACVLWFLLQIFLLLFISIWAYIEYFFVFILWIS